MGTAEDVRELRSHFMRGDRIVAVHYSCENMFEAKDHPPAVSCISYCPVNGGPAGGFSRIDGPTGADGEKWALQQFYSFMRQHQESLIVHWNMNKADFGFAALESRYRSLFGEDVPYTIPQERLYDLDDLVAAEHGAGFVAHPRLIKLASANDLSRIHALSGKTEADNFKTGDHGSIRRSTDEKVRWIAVLAERFLAGSLVTDRSAGSVVFADRHLDSLQTVIELAYRSRNVARELRFRHDSRSTIEFTDEYDDQDFFRSLLRLFFDDIRPEDHAPSYAGGNSRIDFYLPAFKLAVELKHTRTKLRDKELGEELIVDMARYANRDDIVHVVVVVFDYDGYLRNPRGLEADLSRTSSTDETRVTITIVDR